VCGIGALHEAAVAARVVVVSGASSVPALSGAAADHLSSGLAEVDSIDIGISPGNRTERGPVDRSSPS
jgi:molybdopterin biosynthesis enzyme